MKKSEKKRLAKIRHHQRISKARKHLHEKATVMMGGMHITVADTDKIRQLVGMLSNKDAKTIANLAGNSTYVAPGGLSDAVAQAAIERVAEHALTLEKE